MFLNQQLWYEKQVARESERHMTKSSIEGNIDINQSKKSEIGPRQVKVS